MTTNESILSLDRTLCRISCASKKRLVEKLAGLIADDTGAIQAEDLFELLLARERLGSTGIGSGVAIPHCRCRMLNRTIGALITLDTPIDFDSIDGQPVDIVFAMLVPENAEDVHLQTLARLAESLQHDDFVKQLRTADNPGDLLALALKAGI